MAGSSGPGDEARADPPAAGGARRYAGLAAVALWLGLLVVFGGFFWAHERGELREIGAVARRVAPLWLLAALATVPLSLALTIEIYTTLLRRLGATVGRAAVWRAHLRSLTIGMAGPLGGPSGIVVFVRSLAGNGVSQSDALLTLVLSNTTGFGSFLVLLVPVLALLYLEGRLPEGALLAAAVLAAVFALIVALLWLALRGPLPPWALRRLPGRFLPVAHHLRDHRLGLRDFLRPYALATGVDLLGALTLALCIAALGERPLLSEAILGAELGALFTVISPFFQGLGAVEFSLTVTLERFGLPVATALGATLLYRGCTLWVPFLLGLLSAGWEVVTWVVRRARYRLTRQVAPGPTADGRHNPRR